MNRDLVKLIDQAARLVGQRVVPSRLDALASLPAGLPQAELLAKAWGTSGLQGEPRPLHDLTPAQLPAVCWTTQQGWLLVTERLSNGQWRTKGSADAQASTSDLLEGMCWALPRRVADEVSRPRAIAWVRSALLAHKRVLGEAVLATALVNALTLATSLYSMQVYDRVIPAQGYQTLWVLSVGVAIAIVMELVLKQVRSHMVDRVCNVVDLSLAERFFQRMMMIRMEARPASVGTLASQVKGFEMIRGVLASTSLFVLADVPFAIFFVAVIAMVAGWVALVPLVALPCALLAGLMFQRRIHRHTRRQLTGNNLKTGLLVEAVDGAESLKAHSAEWQVQARWHRLSETTTAADQDIRSSTSLAQNLTVALQQISYVALVALGAYYVTLNELTMGGLLACTIVSNRAMMPIVQLPGVMVQWAHARVAMEGLDQILALPNEEDDAAHALAPEVVLGGLKFERVRFTYGANTQAALEVPKLEIKPGERVGLLGTIGSGKSTLLKLSSALYRPNEGKVFLGEMDMALLATPVARENVGYLPQDGRLFSGTLRDNLLQGLADPGDEAILVAARRTGLIDLISGQPKGLALEITEGGRGVSGGQKQLILLTRMLLAQPKVWLLDEPTGSMDSVTEARVVQLLAEVCASGATLVAATHKTGLLPLFDRLIVLQNGRIVADGPRDLVLAKMLGKPPQQPKQALHAQAQEVQA